ncbi:MAG: HAD family phosphatase [Myxococcota bacterium]|nr:HAD family phosphatase [Myxococcota bacterium]
MPRYPLVCFDLDGTLVSGMTYVWTAMHQRFGTDAVARQEAKEAFFAGRIAYEDWFDNDIELLRAAGATRALLLDLFRGMPLVPGSRETLAALRAAGVRIAVLSGSVDLLLETALPGERFDHVLINRLRFDADGRLAGGSATPFDVDRKGEGIRELCRREGIGEDRCAFVGDNENDLSAAHAAGFSVAFDCKSERLARAASVVVPGGDLRAVLPYVLDGGA